MPEPDGGRLEPGTGLGLGLVDDARNSYAGGGGAAEGSSFVTRMTEGVFGLWPNTEVLRVGGERELPAMNNSRQVRKI